MPPSDDPRKPIYTTHARKQMALRGITEAEVEATIARNHTSYPDKAGNQNLISHVKGRRIKVVVAKDSDPPRIITAAD
jgi:Domain of unknown function (DUF4258)